jgi:hypothetical protein
MYIIATAFLGERAMKISSSVVKVVICVLSTISLGAQVRVGELTVTANMDIYQAGGNEDGSNGIPPTVFSFRSGPGQYLSFLSVTGEWTCSSPAIGTFGPDGTTSGLCAGQSIMNPIGTFSGYNLTDFAGAMVGIFLEDSLPGYARSPLRFYISNPVDGGPPTDFRALTPRIGQVFFIGDGLTGTGTGRTQAFVVPPTATHLYLGFVDSCTEVLNTVPGCYSDNAGAVSAKFVLYGLK